MFLANCSTGDNVVTLIAAGDILLDRGVRRQLDRHGYSCPYALVADYLHRADIALANLECPLTEGGAAVFKDRGLVFRGDPAGGEALKDAGFTILNVANNHTLDYGPAGLADTLELLRQQGIIPLGGGKNAEKARRPVFLISKGLKLGFLGYTVFPPEGYISDPQRAEVSRVDPDLLPEEIATAKKNCEFLVVSFHWGQEYDFYASQQQRELAHRAVDYGADLVLGHHPHVLQGVEVYQGRLIFYSLGNFVFDRQSQPGTAEAILVEVKIKTGVWEKVRITPLIIEACRPRPAKGPEGEAILRRLQKYSEGLNSELIVHKDEGYLDNEHSYNNLPTPGPVSVYSPVEEIAEEELTIPDLILLGARQEVKNGTRYDASYVAICYPGGDVAPDRGVCTDVVIRALRHAGLDLQPLIHEDMQENFHLYPQRWGLSKPDPHIDHRRVPNQVCFFRRHGTPLTLEVEGNLEQWQWGDIVYWRFSDGRDHCGIISDRTRHDGVPLVIHNAGVAKEEDCLLRWEITGHFRYP